MKIVVVSNNDWDGLWYQRQQFASMYAAHGHQVLFINKTLQRLPKIRDFKERFTKHSKAMHNPVPAGIEVMSIYTLPPLKCFKWINKCFLKRKFRDSPFMAPDVLLTYIPTYTALSIIDVLAPRKTAYINVHNYDADEVVPDLLIAEKEMCKKVNFLFGDSVYNRQRLVRISGREVYDSLPGVNTTIFKQAFRGDEAERRRTIVYFGGIGSHLDFSLYNHLSEKYDVMFIGKFNSEDICGRLSSHIQVLPPVSNTVLAEKLRDADVIAILYRKSNYIDGVIPAKIYECLATMKPIIATGMGEMRALEGIVYQADNTTESVIRILDNLPNTETEECWKKRIELANEADWERRFSILNKRLGVYV